MIIDCDSGHLHGNLISCARYRISDRHSKFAQSSTQILLLIHLPRRSYSHDFVSFQGEPWICCHIDELLPTCDYIRVHEAIANQQPLSSIYVENLSSPATIASLGTKQTCSNLFRRIQKCIPSAAARLTSIFSGDSHESIDPMVTLRKIFTGEPSTGMLQLSRMKSATLVTIDQLYFVVLC